MKPMVNIPTPATERMGRLFEESNFIVPVYQRNYAWGDREVDDFWNDLLDLANGERESHFFGQIVTFTRDDDYREVIDGQQRLTTSSIFFAVMRDIAAGIEKANAKDLTPDSEGKLRDIQRDVARYLRGQKDEAPSLQLQANNLDKNGLNSQNYFRNLIQGTFPKPTNAPEHNLYHAYNSLRAEIMREYKQPSTWSLRIDRLEELFQAFVEKFYIVMITAPNLQDAFIIFETLNSRGKDLMPSDIIKNHLFSIAQNKIGSANQKWNELSTALGDDSKTITRFIRTYWAARKKLVVDKDLYRSMSQELTSEKDVFDLLRDLTDLVHLYSVLDSPTSPVANRDYFNDKDLTAEIDTLSRLGVILYFPIFLAMQKRGFSEASMKIIAKKILDIFTRHRIILNDGTNSLETGFARVAQQVYRGELTDAATIGQELDTSLRQPDERVKTAFLTLSKEGGQRGPKKWALAYMLSEFEEPDGFADEMNLGVEETAYQRVFADNSFQLVHIRKDGIPIELINYIGNWTLLENKLAPQYEKAETPEAKAVLLEKSALNANHKLADQLRQGWSVQSIRDRQADFAEMSVVNW